MYQTARDFTTSGSIAEPLSRSVPTSAARAHNGRTEDQSFPQPPLATDSKTNPRAKQSAMKITFYGSPTEENRISELDGKGKTKGDNAT